MKLLIVVNFLDKGGAEKLIVDSIGLYSHYGVQAELLLLNAKLSVPAYIDYVRESGIVIHDLEINDLYSLKAVHPLRKFLINNRFDVIHVHLFPALYLVSLARIGLGGTSILVFTEHSNSNKRRKYKLFKYVERFFYKSYHQLIGITPSVSTNLGNWLGNFTRISTIENGVSLEEIMNLPPISKSDLLKNFHLPEDSVVLLMVASFRYPKDHDTLLKALNRLPTNYILLLAGEGELEDKVKSLVKDYGLCGRVKFLGFRTDVRVLMKSIDINVLSSYYEGMSGVTLESMAAEKMFIGSNIAGIKELVPHENFLFEVGNDEELAEKILLVSNSSAIYREMTRLGLEKVKNFDMSTMVNRYIELYRKLFSDIG